MTNKPNDILRKWIDAINAGDIESVLSLYHKEAILIPTFSNRLLNDPIKIREYFARLGGYEELSIALHEKTLTVQLIDNSKYALCGIYCWRFMLDDELLSFEARFSYFLDLSLARPIIHHHSSQIPRML